MFPRLRGDDRVGRLEGEQIRIGINNYAQGQLGDIVFVELPAVGAAFNAGEAFGTVELFMSISGTIVAINEELADAPEVVNAEPYGNGWMILVTPSATE